MKKVVSKILVVLLAVSTVSQAASTLVLTPKRWWECTFDPKKNRCSREEKRAALIGSIVGGLATAGLLSAGTAAAYGGYKASQSSGSGQGLVAVRLNAGERSTQIVGDVLAIHIATYAQNLISAYDNNSNDQLRQLAGKYSDFDEQVTKKTGDSDGFEVLLKANGVTDDMITKVLTAL